MTDAVKVAVRVRPFNAREEKHKSQLVVQMRGQTTYLHDPENPKRDPRPFTFDYSYWSHDGYKEREDGYLAPDGPTSPYTDQLKLFSELGLSMLENAWGGYNCSIFAYGQTGSGKSYSIMGHGPNKGLVPRVCEELFVKIDERKKAGKGKSFEVTFSMMEIYNEQVRDLLSKKKAPAGGLTVKESMGKGFIVTGLSVIPVGSYADIKVRMNEGEKQRTIAATKMNETSSRAHTIVTVNFTQNDTQSKTSKLSSINLVDLAGSERAKQTEAVGDRFEESKNINLSLLTLGNVIKALCDKARGKNAHVPYRDSVLTKLLKNALGGNSKTVMCAAIGPDAENYEQTLSTLRYADNAKSIKTAAKVNQGETNKIIQALIAEKERLMKELEQEKGQKGGAFSDEELQRIKEEQEQEIEQYKNQMKDMEAAWEKRLAAARKETEEAKLREQEELEQEKRVPHLSNLNEDPALSGKVVHWVKQGNWTVGSGKEQSNPGITISGPRIAKEHAEIRNKDGKMMLIPKDGLVLHNGKEIKESVSLDHQDRIRFGSNNLFVFIIPEKAIQMKKKGKVLRDITYEFAQNEIAKHSGLDISEEDSVLQQEVMSLMQLTQDVNAMAEDMDRCSMFEIMLVSAEARGQENGRTEVYIKVRDEENGNEYLWDKNKFLNRQVLMQEMYQEFEESNKIPNVQKEADPFWEPPDTEVIVGVVSVPLNYLSHMLDFTEEPLTVIDYRAKQAGFLKVDLIPCDRMGREDVDAVVEDPDDLLGKEIAFKIKIHQAMNLPERFEKTWCKYRFYNDSDVNKTSEGSRKNPVFNHEKLFRLKKSQVDYKLMDYLREKSMAIEIWGKQGEKTQLKAPKQRDRDKHELQEYKKVMEEIQVIAESNKKQKGMADILKLIHKLKK